MNSLRLISPHWKKAFATEKPTIFLLCNPHNPTGRVFTQGELTRLISLCNQYQIAIISDEIHMDVRRPEKKHLPILAFIDQLEIPDGFTVFGV